MWREEIVTRQGLRGCRVAVAVDRREGGEEFECVGEIERGIIFLVFFSFIGVNTTRVSHF